MRNPQLQKLTLLDKLGKKLQLIDCAAELTLKSRPGQTGFQLGPGNQFFTEDQQFIGDRGQKFGPLRKGQLTINIKIPLRRNDGTRHIRSNPFRKKRLQPFTGHRITGSKSALCRDFYTMIVCNDLLPRQFHHQKYSSP